MYLLLRKTAFSVFPVSQRQLCSRPWSGAALPSARSELMELALWQQVAENQQTYSRKITPFKQEKVLEGKKTRNGLVYGEPFRVSGQGSLPDLKGEEGASSGERRGKA